MQNRGKIVKAVIKIMDVIKLVTSAGLYQIMKIIKPSLFSLKRCAKRYLHFLIFFDFEYRITQSRVFA